MEIMEIVGIYVAQVVLTDVHLGFWGPSQVFYGEGAKTAILGKMFDKVLK